MRRSTKWLFTVAAWVIFIICGSLLPNHPLVSKNMVVAFGIDYTGENELTLQWQIVSGGDSSSEKKSQSRVVSATGATVSEAAYKISERTGKNTTLTHCNIVVIGKSLLYSPHVYSVLDYLITNAYLSDNACIFACECNTADILSAQPAFGNDVGTTLREIVGMYDSFAEIAKKTIRQYIVDYHRLGQSNWLPVISLQTVPPATAGDDNKDESVLFLIDRVAILNKNQCVGVFGSNDATVINLLFGKIDKGNISYQGESSEIINLYLLNNKTSFSYDYDNKTVSVKIRVHVLVKDILDYSADDRYVDRLNLTDKEKEKCNRYLTEITVDFFNRMQACDTDVFGFCEGFYARNTRKTPLSFRDISLNVEYLSDFN